MDATTNSLNWFEISVSDISRAKSFYEKAFSIEMREQEMTGMKMAFFPSENMNGKVSGALVQSSSHSPSQEGAVVYLNGNPDLQATLDTVVNAGGTVIMPKTHIGGENGYMAFFVDSEGNKVGLHSNA